MAKEREFIFDYKSPFTYSSTANFGLPEDRYGNYQSLKDETFREPLVSRVLRTVISLTCFTFILCTLPVSGFFCIKKVAALERLVVFRLGKLQKVKGPGFVFTLPWLDHWMKVDLKPQIYRVPKQQIITCDGAIVEIDARLHYQIIDVIKSVLQVDKLEKIACELANQCLTNASAKRDQEDFERNLVKLEIDIQTMLNKTTISWGLEVTRVDVGPVIILKPAEQRNGISALISTIKSAVSSSSKEENSLPNVQSTITDETNNDSNETKLDILVKIINEMLIAKADLNALENCCGVLEILVKDLKQVVYICIRNGRGTAFISTGNDLGESDVRITLRLSILVELVQRKQTPLQAFMAGTVKATGNLALLKSIGDVFAE